MPLPLNLKCSRQQACHFSPLGRSQFGYVTALGIKKLVLVPDILVVEPLPQAGRSQQKLGPAEIPPSSKAVVGIVDACSWRGRAADTLSLAMLASAKNSADLELFFRKQKPRENLQVEFALTVYRWDELRSCYYARFCAEQSPAPSAPGGGSAPQPASPPLQAILISGKVEESPVEDETLGGIFFKLELVLSPTETEQSFLIATSQHNKDTFKWGEAPHGGSPKTFME
jgi:hypothetical protein